MSAAPLGIRRSVWVAAGLLAAAAIPLALEIAPKAPTPEASAPRPAVPASGSPRTGPPVRAEGLASSVAVSTEGSLAAAPSRPRAAPVAARVEDSSAAPSAAPSSEPAEEAIDPVVRQDLWLAEIAAARAAARLGLDERLDARAGTPASDDATPDAAADQSRTHALADEMIVEYLVRQRHIAPVLPDGSPGAPLADMVRAQLRLDVGQAAPRIRTKLLHWALAALD